ncbi:hypothetical protein [Streptomyces neyagawaensis]|uniref:hypothetical protein n=1 Tax=Streptomyces neyagawaensis TaxID=42238 RepID=UPI0006E358D9|nr:hypothetical protein [Streptomyces neyagawaensis]MCL6734410.1 hypothetical protein [Streptomyces neyagawaensis]MDE1682039.1 hypothetical protein [Streptomyces neyagawaensis]
MSLPIAFVDCETTHLDAEIGEVWEVAVILREFEETGEHTDTEYVWQFAVDLTHADPEALRIGRYDQRNIIGISCDCPAAYIEANAVTCMTRADAVKAVTNVLSGAVIVGSNPGFDDRHLRKLLGPGSAQWHYRPYDIVQLAAARIGAQAAGPLPWRAHVLSRAVGVEPPTEDAAHTALGDARWARDVYHAAMVQEKFPMSWEGRARHAIGLYTKTAVELEDARRELGEMRGSYERACQTIAAMHKAAVGEVRGPIRGVVEDVEDVRASADRVRALLTAGWLAAPHGADDHDHVCPDDVRKAVADALDGPSQPLPDGFSREVCVTVKCAACEYEFDEDESSTIHFEDLTTAHATLRGYDWTILADGRAICPAEDSEHQALHEPGDAPSPPVSPGQTTLDTSVPDLQTGDEDEEFETGDSDGDVLALISEIAGRLRDATDEGEYHAVGLIADLANGRTTIADARTELAEITFRHV